MVAYACTPFCSRCRIHPGFRVGGGGGGVVRWDIEGLYSKKRQQQPKTKQKPKAIFILGWVPFVKVSVTHRNVVVRMGWESVLMRQAASASSELQLRAAVL